MYDATDNQLQSQHKLNNMQKSQLSLFVGLDMADLFPCHEDFIVAIIA